MKKKLLYIGICILAILVIIAVTLGLIFGLRNRDNSGESGEGKSGDIRGTYKFEI